MVWCGDGVCESPATEHPALNGRISVSANGALSRWKGREFPVFGSRPQPASSPPPPRAHSIKDPVEDKKEKGSQVSL